jgi:hypothetical protein
MTTLDLFRTRRLFFQLHCSSYSRRRISWSIWYQRNPPCGATCDAPTPSLLIFCLAFCKLTPERDQQPGKRCGIDGFHTHIVELPIKTILHTEGHFLSSSSHETKLFSFAAGFRPCVFSFRQPLACFARWIHTFSCMYIWENVPICTAGVYSDGQFLNSSPMYF